MKHLSTSRLVLCILLSNIIAHALEVRADVQTANHRVVVVVADTTPEPDSVIWHQFKTTTAQLFGALQSGDELVIYIMSELVKLQ